MTTTKGSNPAYKRTVADWQRNQARREQAKKGASETSGRALDRPSTEGEAARQTLSP